ncbi:hypothetical protein [Roseateles amylovorans]|uniref:Uncharacterized protein n=1 Tax=Roseateles amylovorans TaxID=2978473 RepID=A0ABY6ASH2_9BURK|nr:hypothetical protein [Roseateles amylovorans]UXH76184.1 hypothetical protein N4261_13990 [Roseateles amylovorans]
MSEYKYYVVDYATGVPREVYRSDKVAAADFGTGGLWRARKDGEWSDAEAEVKPLLNLWMKGDFDPEDDEISEDLATAYLNEWRTSGRWPGRE